MSFTNDPIVKNPEKAAYNQNPERCWCGNPIFYRRWKQGANSCGAMCAREKRNRDRLAEVKA